MVSRPTTKQVLFIVLVPLAFLAVCYPVYLLIGTPALLLPPVLVSIFLGYLIVETRHHALSLFVRSTKESRAMFAQFEALLGITQTLVPNLPLPPTRGWSASPDLLREIVQLVLIERPTTIVEASSGTSTLVIAYCLQKLGGGRVIALEHDTKYAARTRGLIKAHGLQEYATIVDAPLIKYQVNGTSYLWYDHAKANLDAPIDVLVVDGPPDTTAPFARFPALPLLKHQFKEGTVVLLDDGAREDERITAQRWSEEFGAATTEYLQLEKGAWLLRF